MPVGWPVASLILATLFSNFLFWMAFGNSLSLFHPLPLYAVFLGCVALLVNAAFFLGPALLANATRRPLFRVVEDSVGSFPAFALRLCCVLFLMIWIAVFISIGGIWWSSNARRPVSNLESVLFVVAVLAFLFLTGLQSIRAQARLAMFTNKLGIAILLAALIRVHDGWPAILGRNHRFSDTPSLSAVWDGLSDLAFYVAPLALLAADFGYRSLSRKQVMITGIMGVALPLFGTLVFVGVINTATFASPLRHSSLPANIGMALLAHAAPRVFPARLMIVAITMFGAIRFGVRALAETTTIRVPGTWWTWPLLGCFAGAIAWLSVHSNDSLFTNAFQCSTTGLVVTSAVLTGDFLMRRRRAEAKRIDWVGSLALLAGLTVPLFTLDEQIVTKSYGYYWILPSYLVALVVCVCGRAVQRAVRAHN